jgi:hypothetical protein
MHTDTYVCRADDDGGVGRKLIPPVLWQREVPAALRSLDTFERCDYADVVTAVVSGLDTSSPERIVTDALRDLPSALRTLVPSGRRSPRSTVRSPWR